MSLFPDRELLVNLRKELHKFPEISGCEEMTSTRIGRFLRELEPDRIFENIGGKGLAASFRGDSGGSRVMIRAELDALPINETNDFDYRSSVPGVSHKCGHDGHMAIAAGVAKNFAAARPARGELIVLYQPSEENGRGAYEVINDPLFESIRPDYILALHNLPGFERNEIILRDGVFAMASTGMIIELKGRTSHAAEPENGISPSKAVSRILKDLPVLAHRKVFRHFALATIIYVKIGEVAFGTNPGEAVVMATLRAYDNAEMENLTGMAENLVKAIAKEEGLEIIVKWTERFPATGNNEFINGILLRLGKEAGLSIKHMEKAFRWSEDFGWFTKQYQGSLFGIGAGKGHPQLHSPDYDFPDDLLETGTKILTSACRELLKI